MSPYGITFFSAFLMAGCVVYGILRKEGMPTKIILYSLFMNGIFVLTMSKLYTSINSGYSISFYQAGFSSVGGMLGLLFGVFLFNKIYGEKKKFFWKVYVLVLPLLYGVSKLGCHFADCCRGIEYSGIFQKICVEDMQVVTRFPVQILESIVFLILFFIGIMLYLKNSSIGIEVLLILCAFFKFSLEYLRQEHINVFLSLNQCVCIVVFFSCLIEILIWKRGIKC